jgi:hypothetical protein
MGASRAAGIKALTPHDDDAGQRARPSANTPTWDWRHLAARVSQDTDRVNHELNAICMRAAKADLREREPEAKYTKRKLASMWKAYDELPRPALRIVAAELRQGLSESNIEISSDVTDSDLANLLVGVFLRATAKKPSKPLGSRGKGARIRLAVCELVDLHRRETGSGLPYKFAGDWRNLAPVEFAATVLREWQLEPPDRPFSAQSLAAIWYAARPKMKSGKF